jgi:ribose transport system ATP-binding protein
MLSGAHSPDKGSIYFEGEEVENLSPHSAMKMGIQTIYQEHNLFPLLDVVENLYTGNQITKGLAIDRPTMIAKTRDILEYLHSEVSPFDIVGRLSSSARKVVEIAKALVQEAKVIIFDEPTASFSQVEIDHLFEIIKRLVQNGKSIIYISHHLEEVFRIADRVTVLRDGKKVNTHAVADLTEQELIRDMVGRDVSLFYQRDKLPVATDVVFEARNLTGNGVRDISFSVRRGEILGIAGMDGSGRTELAELLFGVKKADSGEIFIKGKRVRMKTPLSAIKQDMCFITEDRQALGLFLKHTLVRNIPIVSYTRTRTPFALPSDDIKISERYVAELKIRTPSLSQLVVQLSGGNQQKVVLAKWFASRGEFFIFDEPTRGIDVGAKEEIYRIMVELLRQGKSIIMISSDMPELVAMSDRIIVMRNGMASALLENHDITQETVLKNAIGVA